MIKQYRLVHNENLCIGCQACNVACRVEHSVPDEVYRLQVHVKTHGIFPNLGMSFERMACVMCENPSCVSVCPTGASFQTKEGLVQIHEKLCVSCKYCILACAYHARFVNPITNTVEKCTFCYETRLSQELPPACVSVCPTEALSFGDKSHPNAAFQELLRLEVHLFPKEHLGTKPRVSIIPRKKGVKA